jgi:hypothetical protein
MLICSPHPWRPLKTKGGKRQLPLIGSSMWAAKQIIDANATYAFAGIEYGHLS